MLLIKKNENIKEKIIENDLNVEFVCGDKGKCGKCRIKIIEGIVNEVTDSEKKVLNEKEIREGIRLACMLKHISDIVIDDIKKNDFNKNHIKREKKLENVKYIIAAIDLGTTTIEIDLYCYETKEKLESIKFFNPQKKYGADVLSRLNYAYDSIEKKNNLRMEIVNKINEFDFAKKIKEIYCAGNTIMQYIFFDLDIKEMMMPPFEPNVKYSIEKDLKTLGINTLLEGKAYSFPLLGGFVGGDIYAVLADYISENVEEENVMLIDIGTNGEIVLIHNNQYYTASTAAGPAFEGANIECGMRAESGALKIINLDNKIIYETIDNVELKGICGSSLIQLISELYYHEIIDKTGKLEKSSKIYPEYNKNLKENKFYITEKVYISQNDIREFQLAKAAIRGAIETILEIMDLKIEKISKMIVTGNFGKNIEKKSLIISGIVPNIKYENLYFKDNMVISGLEKEIKYKKILKKEKEILKNTVYINLSENEKFKKNYIKYIDF